MYLLISVPQYQCLVVLGLELLAGQMLRIKLLGSYHHNYSKRGGGIITKHGSTIRLPCGKALYFLAICLVA